MTACDAHIVRITKPKVSVSSFRWRWWLRAARTENPLLLWFCYRYRQIPHEKWNEKMNKREKPEETNARKRQCPSPPTPPPHLWCLSIVFGGRLMHTQIHDQINGHQPVSHQLYHWKWKKFFPRNYEREIDTNLPIKILRWRAYLAVAVAERGIRPRVHLPRNAHTNVKIEERS